MATKAKKTRSLTVRLTEEQDQALQALKAWTHLKEDSAAVALFLERAHGRGRSETVTFLYAEETDIPQLHLAVEQHRQMISQNEEILSATREVLHLIKGGHN